MTLLNDPEALARVFHETYEHLAPAHDYETRKASAKPWEEVPEKNRELMISTCASVLSRINAELVDRAKLNEQERGVRDAIVSSLQTMPGSGGVDSIHRALQMLTRADRPVDALTALLVIVDGVKRHHKLVCKELEELKEQRRAVRKWLGVS